MIQTYNAKVQGHFTNIKALTHLTGKEKTFSTKRLHSSHVCEPNTSRHDLE